MTWGRPCGRPCSSFYKRITAIKTLTKVSIYTLTLGNTWRVCVRVRGCVTYSCGARYIVGYIHAQPLLHLLFTSSSSPYRQISSTSTMRPLPLGATPSHSRSPLCSFGASFLAHTLTTFSLFLSLSPLPPLSLFLSHYLGSDSICRTMLFTMWLHAGSPYSLGAMPELRRRVSLQSTTLLGIRNVVAAAYPGVDFRRSSMLP